MKGAFSLILLTYLSEVVQLTNAQGSKKLGTGASSTSGGAQPDALDGDSFFTRNNAALTLDIEHAFGVDQPFTKKGTVSLRGFKTTVTGHYTQEIALSGKEMSLLEDLARRDGFYLIRAPVDVGTKDGDSKSTQKYASTFVKACYLYGSRLSETMSVSVDYAGNVIGISLVSPKSACPGQLSEGVEEEMNQDVFNSTVVVQQQVAGVIPDTQTFVKRIEKERSETAKGQGKENKSFLAKYWMYIVPIFLIVMLSSQADPEEGGGGAGGGGGN